MRMLGYYTALGMKQRITISRYYRSFYVSIIVLILLANCVKINAQELQTLKQQLTIAQEKENKLSKEIGKLKFSQNIKWFFAGAFVLFVGWLIGLTIGRQQKKHRTSLFT